MYPPKLWSKTIEPRNYDQIYTYVQQELDECLGITDQLESDYYQSTTGSLLLTSKQQSAKQPLSVNTLLGWSRYLNELRNARSLYDIRNGKTMRDLLSDAKTGTLPSQVSDEGIFLMKRILDKTSEQLYSQVPTVANKIADCMNLMEQYFLSFYQIENIQEFLLKKKPEKVPVGQRTSSSHFALHGQEQSPWRSWDQTKAFGEVETNGLFRKFCPFDSRPQKRCLYAWNLHASICFFFSVCVSLSLPSAVIRWWAIVFLFP